MQFQIPQFIETEDKIVGPLTMKQFMYIGVAAGISFILFFTLKTGVWLVLSIFILGFAAALAFVKINGRELIKVISAALHFYWQPQTYVWQSEETGFSKNESLKISSRSSAIENIIRGMALKRAWQKLQTGSKETRIKPTVFESKEIYQIIERRTGEREAARRVDYR